MTVTQRRSEALAALSDDQLGTVAVSVVVGELQWTPDVAPAVMDRIARDAVTYPEQFDRRAQVPHRRAWRADDAATPGRTITRIFVIVLIILLVAGLVVVAATTNASVGSAAFAVARAPALEILDA
jgi:hypothetical protein